MRGGPLQSPRVFQCKMSQPGSADVVVPLTVPRKGTVIRMPDRLSAPLSGIAIIDVPLRGSVLLSVSPFFFFFNYGNFRLFTGLHDVSQAHPVNSLFPDRLLRTHFRIYGRDFPVSLYPGLHVRTISTRAQCIHNEASSYSLLLNTNIRRFCEKASTTKAYQVRTL
jgi:hypothetical protein